MPTVSPLRIAVVGGGNIGSTFAFQLACFGRHDVTVVARPGSARLAQLQRDRGIVKPGGARADLTVAPALDASVPYDLVIVTVPVHQVDALVPVLQRSAAARILLMFNQFEPGQLAERIGADRCDFGMPFVQASIDGVGQLQAVIGAGGQKTKLDRQRWVNVFNHAGLPAVVEPEMQRWLRCHVPLCVAFESICVTAAQRHGGATWSEACRVARGMQQGFTVIKRRGTPLYPAGKVRLHASPYWVAAAILWSVSRIASFRTLLAQGARECAFLADLMVAAAHGVQPPLDATVIAAMKPTVASDRIGIVPP